MRKLCSVLMALLILMSIFAVGASASEVLAPVMEKNLIIQRGITADRSINLQYFEKLDSDDVFWEVENDRLFYIDNDGVLTFNNFAAFFGGSTNVKALDSEGNVLGQTKVILMWKWYYYLITALFPAALDAVNLDAWHWWWIF